MGRVGLVGLVGCALEFLGRIGLGLWLVFGCMSPVDMIFKQCVCVCVFQGGTQPLISSTVRQPVRAWRHYVRSRLLFLVFCF